MIWTTLFLFIIVFAYDLDWQPSLYRIDPFLIWHRVHIVFGFWQLIIGIKCWMVPWTLVKLPLLLWRYAAKVIYLVSIFARNCFTVRSALENKVQDLRYPISLVSCHQLIMDTCSRLSRETSILFQGGHLTELVMLQCCSQNMISIDNNYAILSLVWA